MASLGKRMTPVPTSIPNHGSSIISPTAIAGRRRDIQGLRAIAVLMVVAFHAGLPLAGGFVGVDVFFVISGFVITAMLYREVVSSGRIRFRRFYFRRFTRLTPALALTVTFTILVSALVMSPFIDQPTTALTGVGAMLLGANVVISSTTGDYFDAPAITNPLLNMWSLSVEEQFYLVFPAVLAIGWLLLSRGVARRVLPFVLVGGIAVVSFALAVLGSEETLRPGLDGFLLGFYSPFTRAWEFAVGALLALLLSHGIRVPPRWIMTVLAYVGLGLLAGSIVMITDTTPFPGVWTLLPVTGTLLLIYAGSSGTNPVSSSLSVEPMVKVGDWSYSIYLWHWPVIVFAVYVWPFVPAIAIAAALASLIPALASYYWVEQPIRDFIPKTRLSLARLIAVVMLPPLILGGLLGVTAKFYWQPQFVSGERVPIHPGDTDWPDFYSYLEQNFYPCANDAIRGNADAIGGLSRCSQTKASDNVEIAIVGDSHAEHFFVGMADALPNKNIAFYTLAGTAPVEDNGRMSFILEAVLDNPSIKEVIVGARWGKYEIADGELAAVLKRFSDSGKKVFVTDDVPGYPFPTHRCQYGMSPLIPIVQCSQPRETFDIAYSKYLPQLEKEVAAASGVILLTTSEYLCDESECDMTKNGEILYRDYDHLNNIGSRYFVERLLADNPEFRAALTSN